jgi:catechol 2,3-dioxygenase
MGREPVAHAYGIRPPGFRLPDETRVGQVRLQVSDLGRAVRYYRDIVGLDVIALDASRARLAAHDSATLVELEHAPGTRAVPRGAVLGLYHFAILLPSRAALGQFVRHLARQQVQFGAADHLVSEAIYLWDPDGLGIEVYADRSEAVWQTDGRELVMTTERLNLKALVEHAADAADWSGMPAGSRMGHLHLSVGDLGEASRFYHRALGLDTTVWTYPGALFMAAGGYHHHLGTNTWAVGARKPTPSDARLLEWELLLPDAASVAAAEASVRAAGYDAHAGVATDPWGTSLRLKAA